MSGGVPVSPRESVSLLLNFFISFLHFFIFILLLYNYSLAEMFYSSTVGCKEGLYEMLYHQFKSPKVSSLVSTPPNLSSTEDFAG